MHSIIDKVYVINLQDRPDRWQKINKNFSNTSLELTRWEAVNGKELSEDKIERIATPTCQKICSPAMIGCWMSHFSIWNNIVKNEEDNVLILEDDAYPVDGFDQKLKAYWSEIPKDWDVVYLGCSGSCDKSKFFNYILYFISGKKNKLVYKNKKLQKHVIRPSFPLAAHAYMISLKGARKMINNPVFERVFYHIDFVMSKYVYIDDNFKVYAIKPYLIYQWLDSNYSNMQYNVHPLIDKFGSKYQFSENHTIDSLLSVQVLYIRKIDVTVTLFMIIIFLMSLLVGLVNSRSIIQAYLIIVIAIYLFEVLWKMNLDFKTTKGLFMELLLVVFGIFLGKNIYCLFFKE